MTADEYREHLVLVYLCVWKLTQLPLEQMLDAIHHAEGVGPILDPTLYRNNADKMVEDKAIIQAGLAALESLPKELRAALHLKVHIT